MKHSLMTAFAFSCALIVGASAAIAMDAPQVTLPTPATAPVAVLASAEQAAPPVALPAMATLPASTEQSAPKDKVADSMHQAVEAYQAGKYKEALKLSDEAQAEIRNKHSELYRALLPAAPGGGWTSDDKTDSSATLGAPIAGGMSVVARNYKGGGHTATISYITDSPMMTMFSGIMQVITSASGPNTSSEDIKGYKATYHETETVKGENHQLMIFAGDVMVMVQSQTLPKETILQFANLVDFDKLKDVQ